MGVSVERVYYHIGKKLATALFDTCIGSMTGAFDFYVAGKDCSADVVHVVVNPFSLAAMADSGIVIMPNATDENKAPWGGATRFGSLIGSWVSGEWRV